MRLSRIEITNFRSHAHTILDELPNVAFIVGQNRSGKSSIFDAISYGFRGVCRGTDEGGRGAEVLTRQGATSFEVLLTTDAGVIQRGNGQGPRSDRQKAVDAMTGTNGRVDPLVLLDPQRLLDLPTTEQKTMLQRALTSRVDPEAVRAAIGPVVARLDALRLDWSLPSSLDAAERYCRDRRKLLKQSIDATETISLETFPQAMRALSAVQAGQAILDVEAKLKTLRDARRKGAVDLSALEAAANGATTKHAEASERLQQARTLAAQHASYQSRTTALEDKAKRTQSNLEAMRAQAAKAAGIEATAKAIEAATEPPKCDACQRPMDEAVVSARLTTLYSDLANAREAAEALPQFEALFQEICGELAQSRAMDTQVAELAAEASEAETDFEEAAKDAAAHSVTLTQARAAALTEEQVQALDGRIGTGEQTLASLRAYQQVREAIDRQDKTRRGFEVELVDMEALVAALGPGGVRQKLAKDSVGDFALALVQAARTFGLQVGCTMEPYAIYVNGRSPVTLSRSERLAVGIAFQVALSKLAGFGFICIDDAEIFDTERRAALHQVIAQAGVPQVFVAATLKMPDAAFKVEKAPPGWGFFLVQNQNGVSAVTRVA